MGGAPTWNREMLVQLCEVEGLSVARIVERLGPPATPYLVARDLDAHGIVRRRSNRTLTAKRAATSRDDIERLYFDEGRSLDEAAEQLGVARRGVDLGWPISTIAEHLGVSAGMTQRALHRLHLPVAVRPGRPRAGMEIPKVVRFDQLAEDREIIAALAEHQVPLAGVDPPSRRAPLAGSLLKRLLVDLGLSRFEVEFLTGRTIARVSSDAVDAKLLQKTANPPSPRHTAEPNPLAFTGSSSGIAIEISLGLGLAGLAFLLLSRRGRKAITR